MAEKLHHRGYNGTVENSEIHGLEGYVLGIKNGFVSYWGSTMEELKKDFETSVDIYIADCGEEENPI